MWIHKLFWSAWWSCQIIIWWPTVKNSMHVFHFRNGLKDCPIQNKSHTLIMIFFSISCLFGPRELAREHWAAYNLSTFLLLDIYFYFSYIIIFTNILKLNIHLSLQYSFPILYVYIQRNPMTISEGLCDHIRHLKMTDSTGIWTPDLIVRPLCHFDTMWPYASFILRSSSVFFTSGLVVVCIHGK